MTTRTTLRRDLADIKRSFPIFDGALKGWSYLDNAATTQKPESVIQTITEFYRNENANVHRGLYHLSSAATQRYEGVRKKVKSFIENKFSNLITNSFKSELASIEKQLETVSINPFFRHSFTCLASYW